MNKIIAAMALVGAMALMPVATPAHAQDCISDKVVDDLEDADVDALYACIKDALEEGYQATGDAVAKDYRSWGAASTRPAVPGVHGTRFLMTFVNAVGFDEYVKFADEDVSMPVGSVIAKESFKLDKKGKVRRGPLFIMTKMDAGSVPETADWVYGGVQPNGKPMKFKQAFCHDCHSAFEDQDALGYPIEDVRVAN